MVLFTRKCGFATWHAGQTWPCVQRLMVLGSVPVQLSEDGTTEACTVGKTRCGRHPCLPTAAGPGSLSGLFTQTGRATHSDYVLSNSTAVERKDFAFRAPSGAEQAE